MSVLHLTSKGDKDGIAREAIFDPDRHYRWWLSREWVVNDPVLTVIGLSATPADHQKEEQTITKMMRWARPAGFGSLVIVDLFGLIAQEVAELERSPDPVGPFNDYYLGNAIKAVLDAEDNRLVVAWGINGAFKHRDKIVMRLIQSMDVPMWCFGVGARGEPWHAVRLSYSTLLLPYAVKAAAGAY